MPKNEQQNAIQQWNTWFEQAQAKRAEHSQSKTAVSDAERERGEAEHALKHQTEKYNHAMNGLGITTQTPADEAAALVIADLQQRAQERYRPDVAVNAKQGLEVINSCLSRYQDALVAEAAAIEHCDTLAGELAEVEAGAPKATPDTLKVMRDEIGKAEEYRQRIADALDDLDQDGGALENARQAAQQAQNRVEEMEAMTAIGFADEAEVKAATTQQSKAKTLLEKLTVEANRQENLRRGLLRKLDEADAQLTGIDAAYKQAVVQLSSAALADAEARLVEHVYGAKIRELMTELAEHRDALENAQEGASYGRPRIEIRLPVLFHHPEQDHLNRGNLELTA